MRVAALFCACLAACALRTPAPDTATVPGGTFGGLDPDVAAINLAQYSFSGPSRLANRPSDAARSIAALDYLAGEISTNPRWDFVSPITKRQLLTARDDVRRVAGIRPAARSQDVVDALTHFADAFDAGDTATERREIAGPLYAAAPEAVFARLAALPYVGPANIATQNLAGQVNAFGGGSHDN